MSIDAFKAFVAEKVAEAAAAPGEGIDWEKEKRNWLDSLSQLHADVCRWLEPFIANQSIGVTTEQLPLSEENIGDYLAPMTVITVGNAVVKLKPIGTLLIGARGRVDMEGPKGIARLVIVPKESVAPQVRVEIVMPGQAPTSEPPSPPISQWVWKLASAPPRITYVELSEDSFRDALMGVINGRA